LAQADHRADTLVRLEQEGLVEHKRNHGAKVRLIGELEATEIYETRACSRISQPISRNRLHRNGCRTPARAARRDPAEVGRQRRSR
jgi:hypothetical protein